MSERTDQRFERILREYGGRLTRLAAVYEWDVHEREDLLQEIALAIWRAMPAFRGESSERTFIFRIAHNRGLTHRWRRGRAHAELALAAEVADLGSDPEGQVAAQESYQRLAAAVRRLPEPYRGVVALTLEGLSNREVAGVLGTSENTIAVRLTRARRLLRVMLEEGGSSE